MNVGMKRRSSSNVDFGYKEVPANEKENMVHEIFTKVAAKYDVMNDCMSLGMHRIWKDHFVNMIGIPAAAAVDNQRIPRHLDVAGGTGDISFRVLEQYARSYNQQVQALLENPTTDTIAHADRQIVVCDINADMLKVGQKRAPTSVGLKKSKLLGFVEGNAECLPFPDESFDVYTIAFGLRNVTDKEKALRDAFRVLKNGGRLMILEFSHLPNSSLQYLYDQYSFNVIPQMGKLIANDAESYQYLVESIRRFPKQEQLKDMLSSAGFSGSTYQDLQFGIVSVHSGFKLL
jgi:2-methoxy-6-polyprenyl-1,4-benzoquinol methylase